MRDDANQGRPPDGGDGVNEDLSPTPTQPAGAPPPSGTPAEPARATEPTPGPAAAAVAGAPDTLTRFVAFLIDAVAVAVIGMVPVIGGIVGIAYVLFRDGLDIEYLRGRSLGKTLMKLTVVRADGRPMDLATSAQRNWPLVFGSLTQILLFIPVIGWILIPFVIIAGLVFVIIEIVRVLTNPEGRRLGDDYARTRVVVASA
jgi:uncharacterized RDD family membrane protein YckC